MNGREKRIHKDHTNERKQSQQREEEPQSIREDTRTHTQYQRGFEREDKL